MSDAAAPPLSLSAQPPRIIPKMAEEAVTALLKWREAKSKAEKPKLLEHDEFVYLVVTLKKIPQKGRTKPHKISLPRALMNPSEDSSEICLIIDDRPKSNLTKDATMKKIKAENIPIGKVIKLSKLTTDYRPFEAKRKLCDSYNTFFADRKVIPLLPRLLGKQFFTKKKIPAAIDLKHKNWKEQMEKACAATLFYVRTGTCSVVKVGKLSMEIKEIAYNVVAAVNGIAEIVPSKWKNIRSFHLKLLDSLALPIYQTLPDMKLKINASVNDKDIKEENEGIELDNDDVNDDKSNSENVSDKKKKKKGRIHEVRYMDSNIMEMLDDEEIGVDIEDAIVGGEGSENDETDTDEFDSKKRKNLEKARKPAKKKGVGVKQNEKSKDGLKMKKQNKSGEEFVGLKKKKKKIII